MKPILIGICGRSCSGKSTVSKRLEEIYEDSLNINQERFFRKKSDNRERPESLMMDRFIYSLKELIRGNSVYIPSKICTEVFDRLVYPKKIIIVDGFLLYVNEEVVNLLDKKIFIEVSDENILSRRIKRGGDFDNYEYTTEICIPESKKYEQVQRERADVIINGNQSREGILKDVDKYIREYINNLI